MPALFWDIGESPFVTLMYLPFLPLCMINGVPGKMALLRTTGVLLSRCFVSQTAHHDSSGCWVSWYVGCFVYETLAMPRRREWGGKQLDLGAKLFGGDRLGQSGGAKTRRANSLVRARAKPLVVVFPRSA